MLLHEQLDINKVRLTLPFRLNHVNCHAIKGSAGWDLIDTGLSKESTYEEWLQFFKEQSIKPADIKGIYVTHFHPDHYGCSGWLQKYSGAPVYIGAIDDRIVTRYWKNGDYILRAMTGLFKDNGMPEEVIKKAVASLGNMIPYTQPPADMTTLQAGQTVTLGDHEYQVILTPGHSDGHICFYNLNHEVLISGDHLLPEITSCISRWPQPGMELNPLENFLRAIDSIRSLNCKLALPAHGKPFTNIEERIRQLENHHKERLALTKNSTAGGANVYQVMRQVFSQELSDHEIRFAFTETLAHLVYLMYKGQITVDAINGIDIYRQIQC